MRRLCFVVLVFALAVLFRSGSVFAEFRAALVIGNSGYSHVEQLANPKRDATALAERLRGIGFDKVTLKFDLDVNSLRKTLAQFAREAAGADIAAVYFAGHGVEVAGVNYLIPVDARLEHVDDVEFETVRLETVMHALRRAGKLKLVILDACRNNPFRAGMSGTGGTRSVGRGLARVEPAGSDTLVAYAAREGTIAADGSGEHSPYAKALIKHIATPGLDVRLMFGRVRDEVLKTTGRKQEPFVYGSLGGNAIFLSPAKTHASSGSGKQDRGPNRVELAYWDSIKTETAASYFEAYLEKYPNGEFAEIARLRIKQTKPGIAGETILQDGQDSEQAVRKCDLLAASPDDPDRPSPGVELRYIRSADAIAACQAALSASRAKARMHFQLGRAYDAGDRYKQAVKFYKAASQQGYGPAMHALGKMYEHGLGVKRDYRAAMLWFRRAVDDGYFISMFSIAQLYQHGRGVPASKSEALRWFKNAAKTGEASAIRVLANEYMKGELLPQNVADGFLLYKQAALLGDPVAMFSLAVMYREGWGIQASDKQSAKWFGHAAEAGNLSGMYSLAHIYAVGKGVSRSDAKAKRWIERAMKEGGEKFADILLDKPGSWPASHHKRLQAILRDKGIDVGPVDGTLRKSIVAAIKRFSAL